MVAVSIDIEPRFTPGPPVVLFEGQYGGNRYGRDYGLSPDGKRFLMIKPPGVSTAAGDDIDGVGGGSISIVLNWFEELKERVPVP